MNEISLQGGLKGVIEPIAVPTPTIGSFRLYDYF